MSRLAIIHFQPLELYPPVMNLIDYIDDTSGEVATRVFSTYPSTSHEYFKCKTVGLSRSGKPETSKNRIGRLFQYCNFYFFTLIRLFRFKPDTIMYFETLSFLPVYIYSCINNVLGKKIRIFCHYHEYTSPKEYRNGMLLNRWLHTLESRYYSKMEWISHTNADRMNFFKQDVSLQDADNTFLLPNYPPKKWLQKLRLKELSYPVRFVYVGALGMTTMYISTFADWIESHNGKFKWDVFSQQCGKEFEDFLKLKKIKHTQFKGKVTYQELPSVLGEYDIGVILYKGHIPNYIYNAPNKLFEYLACGLDVWFPKEMTTSHLYINLHARPKVIAIDFENLDNISESNALTRDDGSFQPSPFFYESELSVLWTKVSKNYLK